jgi:putative peptide zinc metalloprotease protein
MSSFSIGRGPENDIVLADTSISRRHAELIDLGDGSFRLRDLGSSNGTHYFGVDG